MRCGVRAIVLKLFTFFPDGITEHLLRAGDECDIGDAVASELEREGYIRRAPENTALFSAPEHKTVHQSNRRRSR
jgi:3-oxoacyl-ACP reductase-like protein